jgi:hypothetical protein
MVELRSAGETEAKTLMKTCSSANLSTKNLTLSHLGLKQRLCGDKPTPKSLASGTAATQQTGTMKQVQNINLLCSNDTPQFSL